MGSSIWPDSLTQLKMWKSLPRYSRSVEGGYWVVRIAINRSCEAKWTTWRWLMSARSCSLQLCILLTRATFRGMELLAQSSWLSCTQDTNAINLRIFACSTRLFAFAVVLWRVGCWGCGWVMLPSAKSDWIRGTDTCGFWGINHLQYPSLSKYILIS